MKPATPMPPLIYWAGRICSADGKIVAEPGPYGAGDLLEKIVHACNLYPKLVSAHESARDEITRLYELLPDEPIHVLTYINELLEEIEK